MLRRADVLGMPVEIEWAIDDEGFTLLQARRCTCRRRTCPTRSGCSIRVSTVIPRGSAGAPAALS